MAATAAAIAPGDSTTLQVSVGGADTCSSAQVTLPATPNGTYALTVSPAVTTDYVISCTDADGVMSTQSFRVEVVAPPIVSVSVSPDRLRMGEVAVVTTNVSGAVSCVPSGLAGWNPAASGPTAQTFPIQSTVTLELTCSNQLGISATGSDVVTVLAPPTITLEFDRNPIPPGDTSMLTATFQDAYGCSTSYGFPRINGSSAFQPGTFDITALEDRTFALFCTGEGGESQAFVTLEVDLAILFAEQSPTANAGEVRLDWLLNKPEQVESIALDIDPDGTSGFTPLDLNGDATINAADELLPTVTGRVVSPPAPFDPLLARFRIRALDAAGETLVAQDFSPVSAAGTPLDSGYVKATDPIRARFGRGIAYSSDGRTLAVGAPERDLPGASSQSSGDQRVGAIYVYWQTDLGEWQQQALLKPLNQFNHSAAFGERMALSADGSTLVVGTPFDDFLGLDANGQFEAGRARLSGAVLVYERDARGRWARVARLTAPNLGTFDRFGAAIDLSSDGTVLAVGASHEESNATGVNPPSGVVNGIPIGMFDNSDFDAGAVYLYTRSGEQWIFDAYVKPRFSDPGARFGTSLTLSGNGQRLAVYSAADGESGPNGEPANSANFSAGGIWIYQGGPSNWSFERFLQPNVRGRQDEFGEALELDEDGDVLIAGARHEDSGVGGLNGDPADDAATNSGAAYIFRRDASGWTQSEFLKSGDPQPGIEMILGSSSEGFGSAVAVSPDGTRFAVGAPGDSSAAFGLNGDPTQILPHDGQGAVWVFERQPDDSLAETAYWKAGFPDAGDAFGSALSFAGDLGPLAIGAPGEDGAGEGPIAEDPMDDLEFDAGAVFLR